MGATRMLIVAAAVVAAMVITACGGSSSSTSSTGSGSSAGKPSGAAGTGFQPINKGELTVGMDLQFKPEMYLQNGKPAGYDVDLVKMLAQSLHVKLNIENLDFNGLIPGLQANKFDMVSVGLTPTPQREQVISFTRAYVPYAQVLAVPAKQAKSTTSVSQLDQSGKTITALQGSSDQQLAQKLFSNATVTGYPDQNSAFLQVATGRANAIVVEDYLLAAYTKSNPGQLAEANIAKALNVQYGSWAVPQGHDAFVKYLNSWLCTEQDNGTLAKLYEQDFGTPKMPTMPACTK